MLSPPQNKSERTKRGGKRKKEEKKEFNRQNIDKNNKQMKKTKLVIQKTVKRGKKGMMTRRICQCICDLCIYHLSDLNGFKDTQTKWVDSHKAFVLTY